MNSTSIQTRPKTYFLQEAIERGFSAIASRLDHKENFRPWFLLRLSPEPCLEHHIWDLGDMCSRYVDAFILGRQVTGSDGYREEEERLRSLLSTCDPFLNPFMAGRMLITYVDMYLQESSYVHKKQIDDLVQLIRSKITLEGDVAFYFKQSDGWRSVNDAVFGDFTPYPTFPLGGIMLGLARYVEHSGDSVSKDLLDSLCRFVLYHSGTFEPDGRYLGHTHSGGILTAAVAIMRWAIYNHDNITMDWMKRVFDWTRKHSSSWGWVPDDLRAEATSSESCSITDALHLGLLVAEHMDPSYYGIAEKFVRNQFLENQFLYPERALPKGEFPDQERIRKVIYGSWASWSMPSSLDNGLQSVEGCCLGAGIRGCFLVWDHVITKGDDTVRVNMAFSRNSPWVEVISYRPHEGRLDLVVHDAPRLQVRIPDWAEDANVRVMVRDQVIPVTRIPNGYLELSGLQQGDHVRIDYPLQTTETVEQVAGQSYQIGWRGDTVTSVRPNGNLYPIFERQWMEQSSGIPTVLAGAFDGQLGGPVHW